MSEFVIPGTGEYADIALGPDGQVYLCAETSGRDAVTVYRGAHGQQVVSFLDGAYTGGQKMALYPRLAVNPFGQIAVIYQRGGTICLVLIGVREESRPEAEVPFGVEPCGVAWIPSASYWRVAYVASIFGQVRLVTRDYDRDGRELGFALEATDTTQGVSRILADGSVVLVDQDNRWPAYPNLSRPWQAGALVIGQGNDAPARALGYVNGNTVTAYRVFDGLAFRPRGVALAPDRWTCIATGDRIGIRVVDVPPLVLDQPPQSEIVPLPEATLIPDTLPYVLSTRWPRVGGDGSGNMDCVPVDGQDAVAWVKFASPSFAEWWRWDDDYIYHHEDRSDGLDQPYHFEIDRWVKRRWAVSERIDSRVGNFLHRTADGGDNWSTRPWAMVMTLVAAFEAYPCGGDIGDAPCLVVEYDPTYTLNPRRGNVERFWFALGWGWFRWQSAPYGTVFDFSPDPSTPGLTDSYFHRLGGVRVTPIDPVRPWPGSVPEPPEPEPMPGKPYDEQFFLNTVAPQTMDDYQYYGFPVDAQFTIWSTRTETDYQNAGLSLKESWRKHRNELRPALHERYLQAGQPQGPKDPLPQIPPDPS